MKKETINWTLLILGICMLTATISNGQATSAGNANLTLASSDYLGWATGSVIMI
jgi:hypothetical protein